MGKTDPSLTIMIISNPTTQRDRINYICAMHKKLNPLLDVTPKTTIKNASIEDLCKFDGAAYRRIKKWHEDTLQKKESEGVPVPTTQISADMVEARELFHKCYDLMVSRNEKYGDSWKVLTIPSLANLCEMKLHRIANLPEGAPKTEDELMDTINYCIFGLMKLKNK